MKKRMLLFVAVAMVAAAAGARNDDWGKIQRYDAANKELLASGADASGRVVFIGNSITDNWAAWRPDFFKSNGFVGRGISGQTSYQFLVRFREDVVNLSPSAVVINVGTNDVAENTCPYDEDRTMGNIMSMVEIAQANGIRVVLTSVLPAKGFGWNPAITDAPAKIKALNGRIKAYAERLGVPYVDYYSQLLDADGVSLNPAYCKDGVHPNDAGYEIMEGIVAPIVKSQR